MAKPLYCQVEGCGQDAAILFTDMQSGDTVTLCSGHWGAMLADFAETLGMSWPETADAAEPDDVAGDQGTDQGLPAAVTAHKRERKRVTAGT